MEELNKQIELLKKHKITDYSIENNQVIINGSLYLYSLTECDKDFLSNTTINGDLALYSLTSCDKDFLVNTIINGNLYLRSLTECHKDFLSNTTINGYLYLNSLKEKDIEILRSNIKQIKKGFNKEHNIIYLDGKISRVYSFYEKDNWTVYKTNNGAIHQRNILTETGLISKFY